MNMGGCKLGGVHIAFLSALIAVVAICVIIAILSFMSGKDIDNAGCIKRQRVKDAKNKLLSAGIVSVIGAAVAFICIFAFLAFMYRGEIKATAIAGLNKAELAKLKLERAALRRMEKMAKSVRKSSEGVETYARGRFGKSIPNKRLSDYLQDKSNRGTITESERDILLDYHNKGPIGQDDDDDDDPDLERLR